MLQAHFSEATPTMPLGSLPPLWSGPALTVEMIPAAESERLLPHWRGLADIALDPNPFMAPEFVLPAAMHLSRARPMTLACIWQQHARSRELVGLFALVRESSGGWFQGPRNRMLRDAMMPVATPLLSADREIARKALETFLSTQGLGGNGFSFPGVPQGSAFAAALTAAADTRGVSTTVQMDAPHSRGLDIELSREPVTDSVVIAQEPAMLRSMLEQALAMDATCPRLPGEAPPAIHDAGRLAFLRAMVRGFAQTGQIIMARLGGARSDHPQTATNAHRAAAMAIKGNGRAYLLHMFGPSAHHPTAEAALCCAIRSALDMPLMAATAHPIAGFCTLPLKTQTMTLSL